MTFIHKSMLLAIALLFSFNLSAQTIKPVTIKESIKQVSENEFQLILNVEILKNWKFYVAPDNGEGPVVFSSKVEKNKNVEIINAFETVNKPITAFDAVFRTNVSYLKDKGTFIQTVKLKNPKKSGKIDIAIEYMTCDGTKCLPPTIKVISYNIENGKSSMGSSRVIVPIDVFDNEF